MAAAECFPHEAKHLPSSPPAQQLLLYFPTFILRQFLLLKFERLPDVAVF